MKDKSPLFFFLFIFLVLVFCLIFFFSECIIQKNDLYGGDFLLAFLPWKEFQFDLFHQDFKIPLWNPYQFSGAPFVSNIQASIFYPLGVLYYILKPEAANLYSTLLHILLAGFFIAFFLNELGLNKTSCILAALIFSYNGYFLGHLYAGHLSFVQNYIWLPLIFYFQVKFQHTSNFRYALLAGFTLGIQILGGFPQIAFYTILSLILFVIYKAFIDFNNKQLDKVYTSFSGLAIFLAIGFSLAAIQLIPTYEFTQLSTRGGGISYDFATYESLHPKELFAFLLPDIFGSAVDNTYWRSHESWHYWESCGYIGVLPLLLCLIKTKSKQLKKIKVFFAILAALAIFLALGKYNPLYPLIYKLPGFGQFRIPAQIIYLYVFSLAVIAGIGLSQIQGSMFKFSRWFHPTVCILAAVYLAFLIGFFVFPRQFLKIMVHHFSESSVNLTGANLLYEKLSLCILKGNLLFFISLLLLLLIKRFQLSDKKRGVLLGACIILTFGDLYLFGNQFVGSHDYSPCGKKQKTAEMLPDNPYEGRVVPQKSLFAPNDATRYRFPSISGYDPQILRRYVYYIQFSQGLSFNDHVVNLSGIDITPHTKLIKMLNARKSVMGVEVHDVINEYSYANFATQVTMKLPEEILPFMKSEAFDPRSSVVFDKNSNIHLPSDPLVPPEITNINVLKYHSEEILIEAATDNPCYFVLSEIFYPGWKAELDGKPVKILRANYIFRSIYLPEGIHEIRMYFDPVSLKIGAAWSLFTIVVFLFTIILIKRPCKNGFQR